MTFLKHWSRKRDNEVQQEPGEAMDAGQSEDYVHAPEPEQPADHCRPDHSAAHADHRERNFAISDIDPEIPDIDPENVDFALGQPASGPKRRPPEFEYLSRLVAYRIRQNFGIGDDGPGEKPTMPGLASWELKVLDFVDKNKHKLHPDQSPLTEDEATLLLLAITPHVQPDLLDTAIQASIKHSGEFPQMGGIRPDGKNFRGFLPTGETALFLLGDDDYHYRLRVRKLFDAEHFFSRKKILWLEDLPPGEPAMSGKIIISQDYIDTFILGKPSAPHFSANFPATRIEEKRTREGSLVINAQLTRQVEEIHSWVKHNEDLLERFGMEDRVKKGYRALFYGPPGTGKTLTAGILGNELKKDVYKIDISMVVSKFIGETEKNLELLFARAEDKGWILFFDEADALFGKRTDVRDAHDKYANQEVSYLLQRIEDYNGLIILATNKKNNIDEAFVRRFNAILQFPFPNANERGGIWEKSFPEKVKFIKEIAGPNGTRATVPEDKKEEVLKVIRRYELSGANIMNVVHYVSLRAAERRNKRRAAEPQAHDGTETIVNSDHDHLTIHTTDLLNGIRRELNKESKPFVELLR